MAGAALATVLAQGVVFLLFLLAARRESVLFPHLQLRRRRSRADYADILRIGLPVSVQSLFFSSLSMIIARLIAGWGDAAVAVQKVGSQIESISWMAADGFASAVNAFVAQNYGAKQPGRIRRGAAGAVVLMAGWGILTGALLIVFPQALFRIFIQEEAVLPMGGRLPAHFGLFPAVYVYGNYLHRRVSGSWQADGAHCGVCNSQHRAHPHGACAFGHSPFSERCMVGHHALQHSEGLIIPVWFLVVLRQYLHQQAA